MSDISNLQLPDVIKSSDPPEKVGLSEFVALIKGKFCLMEYVDEMWIATKKDYEGKDYPYYLLQDQSQEYFNSILNIVWKNNLGIIPIKGRPERLYLIDNDFNELPYTINSPAIYFLRENNTYEKLFNSINTSVDLISEESIIQSNISAAKFFKAAEEFEYKREKKLLINQLKLSDGYKITDELLPSRYYNDNKLIITPINAKYNFIFIKRVFKLNLLFEDYCTIIFPNNILEDEDNFKKRLSRDLGFLGKELVKKIKILGQ